MALPRVPIRLSDIRYLQCTVSEDFSDGRGKITSLRDLLAEQYSRGGAEAVNRWFQEQQLTVTVLEQTGKYYTTDHRRVWAVKSMCKKRGIAEQDFNLIVFLQSDASNRGQMQMNAKMTTVNDGVSVVVEKMNRKETIRKKYGETYNEYSFFSSDGAITKLETDEKYRRAVQTEYNLQQLEVRMNTHDNDFRKCVSIVADQRTLTVNGRALYDRLKNDCAGPGEQLFGSEAE